MKLKSRISRKGLLWINGAAIGVLTLCIAVLLVLCGMDKPAPEASEWQPPTEQPTLPPLPENLYGPEDFTYDENGYMDCLAGESVLGIDVSTHQKEIDWQKVKTAGVEIVMIRLGYRTMMDGELYEDEWAQRNYQGAKAAGLKIGAYFFSQAISVEETIEEANYALNIAADWELDMPLVFDWELVNNNCRNAHVDARMLTDFCKVFCNIIEAAGREAMIYFNPYQARNRLYLEELTDYRFWLAMYSDEMDFAYKIDMWQYTCTGSVPGINGDVDINLYFPYEEA